MSDEFLIIGSKPYKELQLNNLFDSFPRNIRCNFSLPNNNNGSICDQLGLCNHLYLNLIRKNISKEKFKELYQEYREDYIDYFYENFDKYRKSYKNIFHAEFKTRKHNKFLRNINCPFKFTKIPRTGYTLIMDQLIAKNFIYVSKFSIKEETRVSHYVKESFYESKYHEAQDEIKILRWLHKNEFVDATLCLLEDNVIPTLKLNGLIPSTNITKRLNSIYGGYKVIN